MTVIVKIKIISQTNEPYLPELYFFLEDILQKRFPMCGLDIVVKKQEPKK